MCTLIFGSSGISEATNMGYMLMAFGLGLIPFSVQYVVLRAFYAYEDTRTPFYTTVIVAAVNAGASALCFFLLPARWAVAGMAAAYGLAYAIGGGVAWRRLRKRLGGDLDGARVLRTYARLCIASIPAALLSGAACYGIAHSLGQGVIGSSRRWSSAEPFCWESSSSPPAGCGSTNSTRSWGWCAGVWVAEAGVGAQPSSAAACRA
jgi:putative peptidoglycan lipid II flippase